VLCVDFGIRMPSACHWVPWAALVESLLKAVLDDVRLLILVPGRGWSGRASLRVVGSDVRPLLCRYRVISRDAVVGGRAICLYLVALLPFGDDDHVGVSLDVDDVAQVIIGVVVGVSGVLLDALKDALAMLGHTSGCEPCAAPARGLRLPPPY